MFWKYPTKRYYWDSAEIFTALIDYKLPSLATYKTDLQKKFRNTRISNFNSSLSRGLYQKYNIENESAV